MLVDCIISAVTLAILSWPVVVIGGVTVLVVLVHVVTACCSWLFMVRL